LLKPNNTSPDYPFTVANEYFTMRLARALRLDVPAVHLRRMPEAVYLIERFDRQFDQGQVTRRHAIDACQLLGKPRGGKYTATTLGSLTGIISLCTNRAKARIRLWQWLVFNLLVGNNDNHLKNLSFLVSHEGIEIAPFYDLLFTAVYDTRLFAAERATWPDTTLTLALPGGNTYAQVSRERVLAAADALQVPVTVARRELDRLCRDIALAADGLIAMMEQENAALPAQYAATLAGERRLLSGCRSMILSEMLARMSR
jgi:serine/threonine-protein kinase HipA